jgi:hypothetical protein
VFNHHQVDSQFEYFDRTSNCQLTAELVKQKTASFVAIAASISSWAWNVWQYDTGRTRITVECCNKIKQTNESEFRVTLKYRSAGEGCVSHWFGLLSACSLFNARFYGFIYRRNIWFDQGYPHKRGVKWVSTAVKLGWSLSKTAKIKRCMELYIAGGTLKSEFKFKQNKDYCDRESTKWKLWHIFPLQVTAHVYHTITHVLLFLRYEIQLLAVKNS